MIANVRNRETRAVIRDKNGHPFSRGLIIGGSGYYDTKTDTYIRGYILHLDDDQGFWDPTNRFFINTLFVPTDCLEDEMPDDCIDCAGM